VANTEFDASVRRQPGIAIIDLRGEIDAFAEKVLLDNAYGEAIRETPKTIVLNFSQVNYINSKGIALIVGLLAKARQAGIRVVVYGLSSHYVEIFQITRLSDFMAIFPDEATALKSVPLPAI
jgi:anti-sigma B factor antagonist